MVQALIKLLILMRKIFAFGSLMFDFHFAINQPLIYLIKFSLPVRATAAGRPAKYVEYFNKPFRGQKAEIPGMRLIIVIENSNPPD